MPTLNEVPEVANLLATILTGEPVTHDALAVIPFLALNLDDPDWLTLEDLTPPSPRRGEGRVRGQSVCGTAAPGCTSSGPRPRAAAGGWRLACPSMPKAGAGMLNVLTLGSDRSPRIPEHARAALGHATRPRFKKNVGMRGGR